MWVFTDTGFASIVVDKQNEGHVLVRFRVREHALRWKRRAEGLGLPPVHLWRTDEADYRWRISQPRREAADTLFSAAMDIDYPNYKNAVFEKSESAIDDRFEQALHEIWTTMFRVQVHDS